MLIAAAKAIPWARRGVCGARSGEVRGGQRFPVRHLWKGVPEKQRAVERET